MARVKGSDVLIDVNNLTDKRFYTRNVDSNEDRMVGAPRSVYVQGRYSFDPACGDGYDRSIL
jgi:Fe(3+) dicitrate transport protein